MELYEAAFRAAATAYAPYSKFRVGAALLFDDGVIIDGANVENASYGLTLCAETVAIGKGMSAGRRSGLVAVAVTNTLSGTITPCGRCRQIISELAQLSGTDPDIITMTDTGLKITPLSVLLPDAFGPASLNVT